MFGMNYRRNHFIFTDGAAFQKVGVTHNSPSPRLRAARDQFARRLAAMADYAQANALEEWAYSLRVSGGAGRTWGPRAVTGC